MVGRVTVWAQSAEISRSPSSTRPTMGAPISFAAFPSAAWRRDQDDHVAGLERGPGAVKHLLAVHPHGGGVVRLVHLEGGFIGGGGIGPPAHQVVAASA